jgi:hypothetical protein
LSARRTPTNELRRKRCPRRGSLAWGPSSSGFALPPRRLARPKHVGCGSGDLEFAVAELATHAGKLAPGAPTEARRPGGPMGMRGDGRGGRSHQPEATAPHARNGFSISTPGRDRTAERWARVTSAWLKRYLRHMAEQVAEPDT